MEQAIMRRMLAAFSRVVTPTQYMRNLKFLIEADLECADSDPAALDRVVSNLLELENEVLRVLRELEETTVITERNDKKVVDTQLEADRVAKQRENDAKERKRKREGRGRG